MKVKDWLILLLIPVICFGIYSTAYEKGITKQLRKELKQQAKEVIEVIDAKDTKISGLESVIKERDKKLVDVNNGLDELNIDLKKSVTLENILLPEDTFFAIFLNDSVFNTFPVA